MEGLQHANVHTLKLDVTDEAEMQSVVKTILEKEGKLDVVVNNAAVPCTGKGVPSFRCADVFKRCIRTYVGYPCR